MKKILITLALLSAASVSFADNFNTISVQGKLNQTTPIMGVSVSIWSGGQQVGTGTSVDFIPDANGVFSANTYISNPKIFLTGADYEIRFTDSASQLLATIVVRAVPFALAVRGDQLTGDQNVFGAYGKVGIGTNTPQYRLVVAGASGETGTIMAISIAGADVIRMTGAGDIFANKFDSGSGYALGGNMLLRTHSASGALFLGYNSGFYGGINTFVGHNTGPFTSGNDNAFVGNNAGYSNTSGQSNSFVGSSAGYGNTTGKQNTFVGSTSGNTIGTGNDNTFIGYGSGDILLNASNNTYVGSQTSYMGPLGNNNSFLGMQAGYNNQGSNNVFLGYKAGYYNISGSNSIVIGANQTAAGNNALNIGGVLYGDLAGKTLSVAGQLTATTFVGDGTGLTGVTDINAVRKAGDTMTGPLTATIFFGDGSGLTGISDINAVRKTGDTMTGQLILQGSPLGLTVSNNVNLAGLIYTNNGKVGIGVANPGVALDVTGIGRATNLISGTYGTPSTGTGATLTSLGEYRAQINASDKVVISANGISYFNGGNIGIGMSNPASTIGYTNLVSLYGSYPAYILENNTGTLSRWEIGAHPNGFLSIGTGNISTGLLIQKTGNVGIGTANPTEKLEVAGNIKATAITTGDMSISGTLTAGVISPANFVGAVMFFAGDGCPDDGWLIADGRLLTREAKYEALFNRISNKYGGDGINNFNLPLLTDGSFIRGTGGLAATIGIKQEDLLRTHTHKYTRDLPACPGTSGSGKYCVLHSVQDIETGTMTPNGGNETRPRNYAMTPCIKY